MKRVLVVDDDGVSRTVVKQALQGKYEVVTAMSGRQALSYLEHRSCDLILLDYEMPVMNGPEVFERLRKDPDTRGIPVMFLTGDNDKEHVMQVLAQKPEGYMLKPVVADELVDRVRQILK